MCNNIQLNRVLPPGPREYWTQLELEHKAAPEHQKWMYNTDPFAARKEVDTRQLTAAKLREEGPSTSQNSNANLGGGDLTGVIDVKMSSALRELVEDAIKKVILIRLFDGFFPKRANDRARRIPCAILHLQIFQNRQFYPVAPTNRYLILWNISCLLRIRFPRR